MKQKTYKKLFSFMVTIFVVLPLGTFAATSLSLSPTSGNYTAGQNFSVTISVSPQSDTLYTVKAELNYPADLLEVISFAQANKWMPLVQDGYDLTDNTKGVLIKTAGYPSGLSTASAFGTVSFRVKKAGSATIKIGSGSLALNKNNQNVFNNVLSQSIFTLLEKPTPGPAWVKTVEQTPREKVEPQVETVGQAAPANTQIVQMGEENKELAAVKTSDNKTSLIIIVALISSILFFGIGFFLGRKTV